MRIALRSRQPSMLASLHTRVSLNPDFADLGVLFRCVLAILHAPEMVLDGNELTFRLEELRMG